MRNLMLLLLGVLFVSSFAAAATFTVTIQNFAFSPSSLTIDEGDTVQWVNQDSAQHTATSTGGPASFTTGTLSAGQSQSVTFSEDGTYSYTCGFHPGMSGSVTVRSAGAQGQAASTATPVSGVTPGQHDSLAAAQAGAGDATVCCEETQSGLFCQNVAVSACGVNSRSTPSACSSTSFCRLGTCFDSSEGTCLDGTPQLVCNANGGTWTEETPPQCNLGCCVLGDQAAFVTLTRCKFLSATLGLETHYRQDIGDEVSCVLSVQDQEKGACVFEFEFERTCKGTTRATCDAGIEGNQGEFFSGRLCSDEDLATNCGPSTETACVAGKDGVYFVDTCGNPANIYDASKVEDKGYWADIVDVDQSCAPGSANAGNKGCGNCNYLQGSICRSAKRLSRATYGDFICKSLNCEDTQDGTSRRHGESWCIYNDAGGRDDSKNSVGSRYYKHICINGEEVLEQCADFRQEECIEDAIETEDGDFSQAACRVNRWQDCTAQTDELDCENTDRRDCRYVTPQVGKFIVAIAAQEDGSGVDGVCVPQNAPGIQFWQGEEALGICGQANAQCVVTLEKGLGIFDGGDFECIGNCHCCDASDFDGCTGGGRWVDQQAEICYALGDCGPGVNWLGVKGRRKGYERIIEEFTLAGSSGGSGGGGIFG